jgi:hypothetical protein
VNDNCPVCDASPAMVATSRMTWTCRGCGARGTVIPEPDGSRFAVTAAPARWDYFKLRQDDPDQIAFQEQVKTDREKIERERGISGDGAEAGALPQPQGAGAVPVLPQQRLRRRGDEAA